MFFQPPLQEVLLTKNQSHNHFTYGINNSLILVEDSSQYTIRVFVNILPQARKFFFMKLLWISLILLGAVVLNIII